MVVAGRSEDVEAPEVVLVWSAIAMPPDDIERRVADFRCPQVSQKLCDQLELSFAIFVSGDRVEEIPRVGEPVRADRSEVGHPEMGAKVLADITARCPVEQLDAKAYAAWNDGDLLWRDLEQPHLRGESQPALLRDDQQLAVRVVKKSIDHRAVGDVDVNSAAMVTVWVAVAGHREQTLEEIGGLGRDRQWIPA